MTHSGIVTRAIASCRYRSARFSRAMTLSAQRCMQGLYRHIPGALDDELLYAVYDLNAMPASFDFLWFLTAAEIERRKRGLAGVHVVLSLFERPYVHPAPAGHTDHVSEADMLWRVNALLVPCCSLLPSCSSYSVSPHAVATGRMLGTARHVWPNGWASGKPGTTLSDFYNVAISGLNALATSGPLRAPSQALNFIRAWKRQSCGDRDLITITLRDYHGSPERNSRIPEWLAFADGLDPTRFKTVFVPDSFNALVVPPDRHGRHETLAAAAHNLPLRLALYESAYLNLYVSNGPAYLAVLDENCRYLMFKILVEGLHATSKEHLANQGFSYGTTPRFAAPYQAWIWENDTAETIKRAFEQMSDKIDRASGRPERVQ